MKKWAPSIFTKGLLLVSLPLFFELTFGVTLIYLQHDYQAKLEEQVRANQVIAHANEMWLSCTDSLTSKMAGKIFGGEHPGYLTAIPRMNQEYERLRVLVERDPADLERLDSIKRAADGMLEYIDRLKPPSDGGLGIISSLRDNMVVYKRTQRVLTVLGDRIREFRRPWLQRSEAADLETKRAQQAVDRASITTIAFSIVIAAAMFTYFMRGIYGGIRQLLQNTDKLARHEPLLPPTGEADELGQLNTSFYNMAKALEAAAERERELARLKDDFFNMVSHDMRTPLSSIAISIESLLAGMKGPLAAEVEEMLSHADENARHLINLITDLLEIEKIQAEGGLQLNIEEVDLHELCLEAKKVVDPLANKAGCTVEVESFEARAMADQHRTLRVIVNLLANAVKFSTAISVKCHVAEDGLWELSVRDNGPGIAPEKQALIFDRYKQANIKDATIKGGAGLGLAVCKALIEAQGGQIGVESDGASGSRFWFRLPKVALVTA